VTSLSGTAVLDFIRLEGPQRAVYLLDARLVGVDADNGKKFTITLIAVLLLLGWGLRALTRVLLRASTSQRTAFWTRQGIKLSVGLLWVFGWRRSGSTTRPPSRPVGW